MKILKKLFGGKEERAPQNDPFANAPIFKQMMEDTKKKQDEFEEIYGKIIPIVKPGKSSGQPMKIVHNGVEHEMPQQSMPVTFPIPFDELSVVFGIDKGSHYEWLQNKHLEIVQGVITMDDLLGKAYSNLISQIGNISFEMVDDKVGMLVKCNGLESSFIMVQEIWEHIRNKVDAKDVAFAIPTQDVFVFCDASQQENVHLIGEQAKGLYDSPKYAKKISPSLYIRKESGEILRA